MQNLIDKAYEAHKAILKIQEEEAETRKARQYQDTETTLRIILGENADEIIGSRYDDKDNAYLKHDDWLFDEGHYMYNPKTTARIKNIQDSDDYNAWEHFTSLEELGQAIIKIEKRLKEQAKYRARIAEREAAQAEASPYRHLTDPLKQLVLDINRNSYITPAKRLIIALIDYLHEAEELPDEYDEYDEDQDEDDE